jgi:GDP-6-deoxy-D-talose 4-dehydrogenase
MSKLFITGADGFTGKHLVNLALKKGYTVFESTALLNDSIALRKEITHFNPEYVIHLAAISSTVSNHLSEVYETNLIGTLHLLNALKALPAKPLKILLASSAQVYGNQSNGSFKEDDDLKPYNHYGISKLSMEMMASQFYDYLPISLLRPFNYTGRGHNEHFVIPKIIKHFRERSPSIELGNIDTMREYNDVRSICEIYLDLLDKSIPGEPYNICSGTTHTLRDVIQMLKNMSHHEINIIQNEKFMRSNEPMILSGNPNKLESVIGKLPHIPIEKTLEWMLNA